MTLLEEKLLDLPTIIETDTVKKHLSIQKPNVEMLTEEQLAIFNQITKMPMNVFFGIITNWVFWNWKIFFGFKNN